ncbi:shikimate dehydrogenase [Aurantiacibacter zhengii]|uniref:Shikimate dehydrogenase (NADP(+)) n=1 Tax=Aurantiacibacter zhengii TaxID=2307003 RepID=A0A418NSN5_9SPHN|nr:shikimate dehydrogenase [Aurantiacibacter zhengii]RIV86546.1 shikimate dehydrogenase [Aurantiacibacter zhengii]
MSRHAEVIGDPIAQSKSPAIHGYWIDQLGLNARYDRQQVKTGGLAEYLAARRDDPQWAGCNVTMPHKLAIMDHCDRLDPLAERIGAVNTVVRGGDGSLTGYNTDAAGFLEPLAQDLASPHYFRMARVLGTGGAARAIVAGLLDHGITVVLAGRDPAKAQAILDELAPGQQHHAVPLDHFAEPTDFAFDDREGCFDLVVNASPLGMRDQPPLAFDFSHVPPGSVVYDIVTAPLETPLIEEARNRGFRTVDGLSMLIGQAAVAFEKFFGVAPPRGDGDAQLRRMLTQ